MLAKPLISVSAGGVAAVVFIVNMDDFADASVIEIEAGLKVAVASLENPVTPSETFPLKPPAGVTVTV